MNENLFNAIYSLIQMYWVENDAAGAVVAKTPLHTAGAAANFYWLIILLSAAAKNTTAPRATGVIIIAIIWNLVSSFGNMLCWHIPLKWESLPQTQETSVWLLFHTTDFTVIDSIRQKTIRWVRHFKLHLLVSSLNGAVSLKEVDDITVFVTCGGRGDKKRNG